MSRRDIAAWVWASAAVAALMGCPSPEPDDDSAAPSSPASALSSSALAQASAATSGQPLPSRDASSLNISKYSGNDSGASFRVAADVPIAVEIDLRSGAFPLTKLDTGYRVDAAPKGSLAWRLGLQTGDELISLNDELLLDAGSAQEAYDDGLEDGRFELVMKRGSQQHVVHYLVSGTRRARPRRAPGILRARPVGSGLTPPSRSLPYDEVMAAVATGIKQDKPQHYQVDRYLFALFEERPRMLRRRIYPTKRNGGGMRAARAFDSVLTVLGLEPGDMVRHIAAMPVSDRDSFVKAMAAAGKTQSFSMSVRRANGDTAELHYKLVDTLVDRARLDSALGNWAKLPARPRRPQARPQLDISPWVRTDAQGIIHIKSIAVQRLISAPGGMLTDLRQLPRSTGVRIFRIRRGSPASVLGFKSGDTVLSLDGRPLKTMGDVVTALQRTAIGKTLVVKIRRRAQPRELRLRREP